MKDSDVVAVQPVAQFSERVNNDRKPAVISYAASKVGKLDQTRLEHEILADLVIDAVRTAGLDKTDIGSAVFTAPTPATRQRGFATLNPLAQFQIPLTVEDVMEQPPIVEPLGRYDVPARSDGAICLVVTSEAVARAGQTLSARTGTRVFP